MILACPTLTELGREELLGCFISPAHTIQGERLIPSSGCVGAETPREKE